MKTKSFLMICLLMLTVTLFGQNLEKTENSKAPKAEISWLSSQTIDLGKIEKGKPVAVSFEFTNAGNSPLFITSAKGWCGCTAIEYSKEVIAPSRKGFVKTTYNAEATGSFDKTITVNINGLEKPIVLHIKGVVI